MLGHENGVAVYRTGTPPEYPDTGYAPVLHDQQEGTFRRLLHHFAGVVRGQWAPVMTSADGLAVIRVAAAIDQSLRDGREVAVIQE